MTLTDLYNRLDLTPDTPMQITEMSWHTWGQHLTLVATAASLRLILHFADCREARWQFYTHQTGDDRAFPPATLVNFRSGQGDHRKPCQMLTDYFGLTLLYGNLSVTVRENDDTADDLSDPDDS